MYSPAFALSSETLDEMFNFSLELSVLAGLAGRYIGFWSLELCFCSPVLCEVGLKTHINLFMASLREFCTLVSQTGTSQLVSELERVLEKDYPA